MGTLGNLFDLVRDTSYQTIDEEANREIAIALAGNSLEVRDRLHKALSRPMESLWAANPFRLIDTTERPTSSNEQGGLLLYALYHGERLATDKIEWLRQVATLPNVSIIIALIPRQKDQTPPVRERNLGQRLQRLNPLRLVGGNEDGGRSVPTGVGADGSSFNTASADTRPLWEVELEEVEQGSNGKVSVITLTSLDFTNLEHELLPLIVQKLSGRELALARRAPVFRNVVAMHFVNAIARSNAETVLLANLTSGLPFLSDLFGGGADFLILTKNQFELVHRLASIYGQRRSGWVELYLELAPIVGAAFLWRSISRLVTGKLPPFLALLPKGAIAYLATFSVGWLAQQYYASGRKAPGQVAQFARNLFEQVTGQAEPKSGDSAQDNPPRHLRSS
jgi:uncharacterized protein (DUF697 family)